MTNHKELLDALAALPGNFHNAGVMPATILEAIERHCRDLNITCSVETGSGLSTLLFSHLSNNHLVFAKEQFGDYRGNSISSVRESTLFRGESVKYVVGPTQPGPFSKTVNQLIYVSFLVKRILKRFSMNLTITEAVFCVNFSRLSVRSL